MKDEYLHNFIITLLTRKFGNSNKYYVINTWTMEEQPIQGRNGGRLLRRKKRAPANPGAGRPKGSLNSSTIISKWLKVKETIDNPITGNKQTLSQFDIIIIKQILNAKTGDTRSFNAILDRLEGKATQAVELGNREDKPLDFSISNLPNISREDLLKFADLDSK